MTLVPNPSPANQPQQSHPQHPQPQHPDPKLDPFTLYGLARSMNLDPTDIQRAYLARMVQIHPDLASDDPEANERAAIASARLNEAKSLLENAERRAITLLQILQADMGKVLDRAAEAALPTGFLMQIMETRQEIETALKAKDLPAITYWREWAIAERASYTRTLSDLLVARDLLSARKALNAWRYIERLLEQLDLAYSHKRT